MLDSFSLLIFIVDTIAISSGDHFQSIVMNSWIFKKRYGLPQSLQALFILMLVLAHHKPVGISSNWLLYSFHVSPVNFDHFLADWHTLNISYPRSRTSHFSKEPCSFQRYMIFRTTVSVLEMLIAVVSLLRGVLIRKRTFCFSEEKKLHLY